jgi:DNA-binding MarR family transcriptional regulator
MNNIAEEAFKDMDITTTQGFTLILIEEKNMHTPSEIAKELKMNPSTITRFMDKLEKLGYIERVYHGRKTEVITTLKGREKLAEIFDCWKKIHDLEIELFGDAAVRQLSEGIKKANKVLAEKRK